ncbi:hypothetical protein [Kitasatospora sp. NPDC050463]|uniref:hypothetical protein n=1 Tax=Kitasatospora sp. NPDC050463 TaxID=3155786 RepID=UPI0033CD3415
MNHDSAPFQKVLGQTLTELARRGVTLGPNGVADAIEQQATAIAAARGIRKREALTHIDPASLAEAVASVARQREHDGLVAGEGPFPPVDNPELAMILAGVPDALVESGGDLYSVILNVAVNAWMAGHVHGEDGCSGCDFRGDTGHDWQARMATLSAAAPDITKWFNRDVWTKALENSGYTLARR